MAQFPSVNNLPTTGPKAMVQLVNLLLTTGVWTVYAWYGQLAAEGRARHIGLDTWAGVGEQLETAGDWVELKGPGNRGIGLMHGAASNLNWWIVYCGGGAPTGWTGVGGLSGAFDACTEIQNVHGAAAAGAALFQADASYRWSIIGYDGTGEWVAEAWQTGSYAPSVLLAFDYVTTDAPTDLDPYVLFAQGNSVDVAKGVFDFGPPIWAYFGRVAPAGGSWLACPMNCLYGSGGNSPPSWAISPNGITGKYPIMQVYYTRNGNSGGTNYGKGTSTLFQVNLGRIPNGDTASVSTALDRIAIGWLTYGWDGTAPLA